MSNVNDATIALSQQRIPAWCKGFGSLPARVATAAMLSETRPGLFGGAFEVPLLALRDSAVRHNVRTMSEYSSSVGVLLAPHGKTAMSPELAQAQVSAGAWASTVATVGQLRTYRQFGFDRFIIANEIVDLTAINWLADEMRADNTLDVYCYVDSLAGVRLLESALQALSDSRPLPVLIEFGHRNVRTGARSVAEVQTIAQALTSSTALRFAGVAGYEGGLGHDASAETMTAVAECVRALKDLTIQLGGAGLLEPRCIVSCGGSAFFDIVVDSLKSGWPPHLRPRIVIRSGAYLAYDHGFYSTVSPAGSRRAPGPIFEPALELWAPVLSRPGPGLALLAAGRRDVSFDEGSPIPLRARRKSSGDPAIDDAEVKQLNDQHAFVRLKPSTTLDVGDLICLGVSHPCTAFDKWRVIAVVGDDDRIVVAVHTSF